MGGFYILVIKNDGGCSGNIDDEKQEQEVEISHNYDHLGPSLEEDSIAESDYVMTVEQNRALQKRLTEHQLGIKLPPPATTLNFDSLTMVNDTRIKALDDRRSQIDSLQESYLVPQSIPTEGVESL
jgi:hypothetical protein